MLITFSSKSHEDVVYFGDIALKLLAMMGRSPMIPGGMTAIEIREALHQLEKALNINHTDLNSDLSIEKKHKSKEISLKTRALPLLQLLKSADKAQSNITWN